MGPFANIVEGFKAVKKGIPHLNESFAAGKF